MNICDWCKHLESEHYLANAGACGNPDCCGSEYMFCEECGESCEFFDKRFKW